MRALMQKRKLLSREERKQPVPPHELVAWRRRLGLSQKDAADALGVTPKAYQNWEQNRRAMRHPLTMREMMDLVESRRRRV